MSLEINKDNIDLSAIKKDSIENDIDDLDAPEPAPEPEIESLEETPPEPEDPIAKRKIMKEIMNYKHSRLGRYLDIYDLRPEALENMSLPEISNLLKEIKYDVGVKTGMGFIQNAITATISGFETFALKATPLKIQGLSYLLQQNEDFKDSVCEVSLKYHSYKYAEPEVRLGWIILSSIHALHTANSTREETNIFLNIDMKTDTVDKYKDL